MEYRQLQPGGSAYVESPEAKECPGFWTGQKKGGSRRKVGRGTETVVGSGKGLTGSRKGKDTIRFAFLKVHSGYRGKNGVGKRLESTQGDRCPTIVGGQVRSGGDWHWGCGIEGRKGRRNRQQTEQGVTGGNVHQLPLETETTLSAL